MPCWKEIKPALIALFSAIAKERPEQFTAEWDGRARSQMSDLHKFALYLEVTNVRVLGVDEIRYAEDDSGEVIFDDQGSPTEIVVGQRQFTLRVEAHALDDTDNTSAMHVATRIQTRLRRSRSLEALDAIGCAIAEIGNVLNTGYKHGGRVVPRATLDITINTSANEADPVPVGVIEHVEWTSEVEDLDGVAPVPPNVVNEMTPPLPPPLPPPPEP